MNLTKLFKLTVFFGTLSLTLPVSSRTHATVPVITEASLLKEMIDRDALARLPYPAYVTKQFSSYDRKSIDPEKAGWYSNDDWSMFIRTECHDGRTEHVMMDTEGPGAIVRFWMTFAGPTCGKGILRIYIDDNTSPVIEAPALKVLSGEAIAAEPLSSSVSKKTPYERRGHNLYYPIPYAKRCKVTYESPNVYTGPDPQKRKGTENVYYNIECRTYIEPVKVIAFPDTENNKTKKTISQASEILADLTTNIERAKGNKTLSMAKRLRPNQSAELKIDGEGAIRELELTIEAGDLPQALRSSVISMCFDGERTVWVPIGDFFGIGYRMVPSATYFTQTDGKNTLKSYWVMPFAHSCEISIHNFGSEDIALQGKVSHSEWEWDDRSLHFGASWHQYSGIKTGNNDHTSPQDLSYTELTGTGRYVGDCLTLYNTVNGWWGEGDEKIYVDGETFPSHYGTGTEDYYGYAWCRPETFTNHPFIGMPSGDGNLGVGYTANCRFRALDAIPFSHSIRFDMELWHWQEAIMNYAPTAIWYMRPGGQCSILPDTTEVRRPVATKRCHIVAPVLSAGIEGEDCTIQNLSGGKAYGQYRTNGLWSRNTQLFWHNAPVGAKLILSFESCFEAKAMIQAVCSMAIDYGTFRISLNGKELIPALNLYSPQLTINEFSLGEGWIRKGENTLTVEAVAPATNFKECFFGLDRINIQPIGD